MAGHNDPNWGRHCHKHEYIIKQSSGRSEMMRPNEDMRPNEEIRPNEEMSPNDGRHLVLAMGLGMRWRCMY